MKYINRLALLLNYNYRINCLVKLISNNHSKTICRKIIRSRLKKKEKIIIGMYAEIGKSLELPHPYNITIGRYVKIGKNCKIYHEVTIGQNKNKFPTLGDNVIVYTGAKIIGDIHIGDNAIIGANAVVTSSVPENAIVGGIPARVLKYRSEEDEFC